jgi:hypothetical protein
MQDTHHSAQLRRERLQAARSQVITAQSLLKEACEVSLALASDEDDSDLHWDYQAAVMLDEAAGCCDEVVSTIDAVARRNTRAQP